MKYSIWQFGGLAPRVTEANKDPAFADVAENVNLSRNSLRPWRAPKKINELVGASLFVDDCCYFVGDCEASFAKAGLECQAFYVKAEPGLPLMYNRNCDNDWQDMAFPCETPALTVMATRQDAEDLTLEYRSYYYTYVNELGWESPPSYPSPAVRTNYGAPVHVAGFKTNHKATAIRLYRSAEDLDYGREQDIVSETDFYLVAELPPQTLTYVDEVMYLGDACETENDHPPPEGIREIQHWREGRLAGLVGNRFVMSEKRKYHAWNPKFMVSFFDTPIALKVVRDLAYVLTDGNPVLVQIAGGCEEGNQLDTQEIEHRLPIVSRRSAALHGTSVVYASVKGLVMLSGDSAKVISSDYYTEDQWRALEPNAMVGEVCNGVYYGTTKDGAIRFVLPDDVFETPNKNALTTLTLNPTAMFATYSGRLYMAMADGVYLWNEGLEDMTYRWGGSDFNLPSKVKLTAYKVVADGSELKVEHFAGGKQIQSVTSPGTGPVRLPLTQTSKNWTVYLTGTAEVTEYSISTSIRGLLK